MLLNPSLQLPEENEFIPADFTLRERPQDVRTKLTVVKVNVKFMLFFFKKQTDDGIETWMVNNNFIFSYSTLSKLNLLLN